MNFLFAIISCIYIAGIFLLADLPLQTQLRTLNPYSLAHILLYAVLTIFLILTFRTRKQDKITLRTPSKPIKLILPGLIALMVAVFDEIYQLYVPGRDASVTDVLLDVTGTGLAILLYIYWPRRVQQKIK